LTRGSTVTGSLGVVTSFFTAGASVGRTQTVTEGDHGARAGGGRGES
jgi:hypothetical protein